MEFFKKTLDPVIALIAIAVLDVFLFMVVGAWTVGGGETMMTGLMAKAVMGDALDRLPFWNLVFVPSWGYWKIYISLGMLFGAFVGALLSKEFYPRFPRRLSEWVMITIGGLMMGIGIRLAFVCNVSTFFGLTPMILETSVQAQFLVPMAISLAFGILFATGITLLLIPTLYMVLEDGRRFLGLSPSHAEHHAERGN